MARQAILGAFQNRRAFEQLVGESLPTMAVKSLFPCWHLAQAWHRVHASLLAANACRSQVIDSSTGRFLLANTLRLEQREHALADLIDV